VVTIGHGAVLCRSCGCAAAVGHLCGKLHQVMHAAAAGWLVVASVTGRCHLAHRTAVVQWKLRIISLAK
jgi:hypothetical protein